MTRNHPAANDPAANDPAIGSAANDLAADASAAATPAHATASEWTDAHADLLAIALERSALDAREAPALLRARRAGVHVHFGFASFHQYVEQLFGYSFRTTEDKLRVAAALESLPALARSLRCGEVTWCAARELSRVATAETEADWLQAAAGRTAREVERLIAGHQRGERPTDLPRAAAQRHVLRFDVSAETLAMFREALQRLRRDAAGPLDDDSALLLLARQILGGPRAAGTPSYQVNINVCSECGRAHQRAAGEEVELDAAALAMACCDADATHVGEPSQAHTQSIPAAIRRRVLRRDAGRCVVPGCRHATFVDVHHLDARADGGPHEPENLIVLCAAHHRAVHRGHLSITGKASDLHFHRVDGSAYRSSPVNAPAIDVAEQVFRGLCNLGYREKQARWAVTRAAAAVCDAAPTPQSLLRSALELLRAQKASAA